MTGFQPAALLLTLTLGLLSLSNSGESVKMSLMGGNPFTLFFFVILFYTLISLRTEGYRNSISDLLIIHYKMLNIHQLSDSLKFTALQSLIDFCKPRRVSQVEQ